VVKATASFEKKSATVKAKGNLCKTDGQKPLLEALSKSGYEAKVKSVD
jgi:hypothetical protein